MKKVSIQAFLKNELLSKTLTAFVLKLVGVAAMFFFYFLLSRIWGAEAVGIFEICFTIISIIVIFALLGLETAIVRHIASLISQSKFHSATDIHQLSQHIIVGSSIILSVFLYILAEPIASLLDNPKLIAPLHLSALLVLPLSLKTFYAETLRGLKKIHFFAILQNNYAFLLASLIILAAFLFHFYDQFIVSLYAVLIGLIIMAGIGMYWIRKYLYNTSVQVKPKVKFTASPISVQKEKDSLSKLTSQVNYSSLLKISFPMLLANSVYFLMTWTDILMLGYFMPETQVGIYKITLQIAGITALTLTSVNAIAAPKFAEYFYSGNAKMLNNTIHQSGLLISIITIPIVIIISFFPGFFIEIFNVEYVSEYSIYSLLILMSGQFVNAMSGSVINILNMIGKEKVVKNILLLVSILNIIMNTILIPEYGIMGAAIATAVSNILWNLIAALFVKKYLGIWSFSIFSFFYLLKNNESKS